MAVEKSDRKSKGAKSPINIFYFTKLAGFTSTEQQYFYHHLNKGAKVVLPKEKVKLLIELIKKETVEITKELAILAKNGK